MKDLRKDKSTPILFAEIIKELEERTGKEITVSDQVGSEIYLNPPQSWVDTYHKWLEKEDAKKAAGKETVEPLE